MLAVATCSTRWVASCEGCKESRSTALFVTRIHGPSAKVLPVALRVLQNAPRDLVVARFRELGLDDLALADLEQGGAGECHQDRRMRGDEDLGLAGFEKGMKLGQERKLALRRQRGLRLVHDQDAAWLESMFE